eukprot:scaffold3768_cov184-Isochrysis_galbana.AAC.2
MGDPAMYPEIRAARSVYALQRLPRDFTADVQARKQWVDNNLTYTSTVSFSLIFITMMLIFVGTRGPPTTTSICAA